MIRNTKKLIADEFVKLAKNRTFDTIMIKEITQNCGAGRQTFYNHFDDKISLVKYINSQMKLKYVDFNQINNSSQSLKLLLQQVLNMLQDNKAYFLCAIKFPDGINTKFVLKDIFDTYFDLNSPQRKDKEYDFLSEFSVCALINVYILRLKNNDYNTKEYITLQTCDDDEFILNVLKSIPQRII